MEPHWTSGIPSYYSRNVRHDFNPPSIYEKLIENTTTKAGLKVFAGIFNRIYETGRKVMEGFKESMRIVFDKHLGQWNYVAMPEAAIL